MAADRQPPDRPPGGPTRGRAGASAADLSADSSADFSADFKDRLLKRVESEPVLPRGAQAWRDTLLLAAAGVLALVVFFYWGGLRDGGAPRSLPLMLETVVGSSLIAGAVLWIAVGHKRSMTGHRPAVLLGLLLATPVLLFLFKVGVSSLYPMALAEWPERIGIPCLKMSLWMGGFVIAALFVMRRHSAPNHPVLTGAALATAGGAWAWVLTDLWCPVAYVPHLMLGHVLPLVLLMGAGGLLGWWLLRIRFK